MAEAVELNFDDVAGLRSGGSALLRQGPDTIAGADSGIEGIMSSVNKTIDNIKDLVAIVKDSGLLSALGMSGRVGPLGGQVYRAAPPTPSLAQQVSTILHRISSAYGDITIAEAIALVAQQYGPMKLSDLEGLLNAAGPTE